jgi:hypothetical protein
MIRNDSEPETPFTPNTKGKKKAMSPDEKGELANSMDTREDFPNA